MPSVQVLAEEILSAHMKICALEPPATPWTGFLHPPLVRDTSDDTIAEIDECASLSSGSDIDTQDLIFDTDPRDSLGMLEMIVARHVGISGSSPGATADPSAGGKGYKS